MEYISRRNCSLSLRCVETTAYIMPRDKICWLPAVAASSAIFVHACATRISLMTIVEVYRWTYISPYWYLLCSSSLNTTSCELLQQWWNYLRHINNFVNCNSGSKISRFPLEALAIFEMEQVFKFSKLSKLLLIIKKTIYKV